MLECRFDGEEKVVGSTRLEEIWLELSRTKTMKTIIRSNWKRLHRGFCILAPSIIALSAMPRNACAQIYIGQPGNGAIATASVSEYNAATGAAINTEFITNLGGPVELALSGNDLFVANASTVGEYNATTGAPIDANLFTLPNGNPVTALVLSGADLFVASFEGTVGEYNASTGAVINANLITGLGNVSVSGLALSGNDLFVSNGTTRVGEYNASSGAAINANLITGLVPFGLLLSDNTLFVADDSTDTVGEYNASTAAPIKANFITGLSSPVGLCVVG